MRAGEQAEVSWKVLRRQPGGAEGQALCDLHPQESSKVRTHIHSSAGTGLQAGGKLHSKRNRICTTDTLRMVIPDPASPWTRQVRIVLGSGPQGFLSQTCTGVWMWKWSTGTPKILHEKVLGAVLAGIVSHLQDTSIYAYFKKM